MEDTTTKTIDIDKPMRLMDKDGFDGSPRIALYTHPASLYVLDVLFHNDQVCLVELDDFQGSTPYFLFNRTTGEGIYEGNEYVVVNHEENLKENVSLSDRAREYARRAHRFVNQTYDGKPYIVHVDEAAAVGIRFKHLIPAEKWETVLAGIYLHDVLEDVHYATHAPLKEEFGEEVTNLSYACANEKGKTRDERANPKYYREMRETPYAVFVKLCDRIANITNGINTGGSMLKRYRKEHAKFVSETYDARYQEMFDYLDKLLAQ